MTTSSDGLKVLKVCVCVSKAQPLYMPKSLPNRTSSKLYQRKAPPLENLFQALFCCFLQRSVFGLHFPYQTSLLLLFICLMHVENVFKNRSYAVGYSAKQRSKGEVGEKEREGSELEKGPGGDVECVKTLRHNCSREKKIINGLLLLGIPIPSFIPNSLCAFFSTLEPG
jgi:hypothetical protein